MSRTRLLVGTGVAGLVAVALAVPAAMGGTDDAEERGRGTAGAASVADLLVAVRPVPADLEPALAPDADPGLVPDETFDEPRPARDDDVTVWDPCDPMVEEPTPGFEAGDRTGGGLLRQDPADGGLARRYVKTSLHRYPTARAAQRALIVVADRVAECVDVDEPGLTADVEPEPEAVTGTPGAVGYTWELVGEGFTRSQHVVLVVHRNSLLRLVTAWDAGAARPDVAAVVRAIEGRVLREEAAIARTQGEIQPA